MKRTLKETLLILRVADKDKVERKWGPDHFRKKKNIFTICKRENVMADFREKGCGTLLTTVCTGTYFQKS